MKNFEQIWASVTNLFSEDISLYDACKNGDIDAIKSALNTIPHDQIATKLMGIHPEHGRSPLHVLLESAARYHRCFMEREQYNKYNRVIIELLDTYSSDGVAIRALKKEQEKPCRDVFPPSEASRSDLFFAFFAPPAPNRAEEVFLNENLASNIASFLGNNGVAINDLKITLNDRWRQSTISLFRWAVNHDRLEIVKKLLTINGVEEDWWDSLNENWLSNHTDLLASIIADTTCLPIDRPSLLISTTLYELAVKGKHFTASIEIVHALLGRKDMLEKLTPQVIQQFRSNLAETDDLFVVFNPLSQVQAIKAYEPRNETDQTITNPTLNDYEHITFINLLEENEYFPEQLEQLRKIIQYTDIPSQISDYPYTIEFKKAGIAAYHLNPALYDLLKEKKLITPETVELIESTETQEHHSDYRWYQRGHEEFKLADHFCKHQKQKMAGLKEAYQRMAPLSKNIYHGITRLFTETREKTIEELKKSELRHEDKWYRTQMMFSELSLARALKKNKKNHAEMFFLHQKPVDRIYSLPSSHHPRLTEQKKSFSTRI